MANTIETLLAPLPGYRSATVARFVWQLDEQRRMLLANVEGLGAADLEWQFRPGMNTIGMLLAHIAYAECHLTQIGLEGRAVSDPKAVIGITEEEEGLPLAPGAPPSPASLGRPLEYFVDMLARARQYTKRVAARLDDSDLERRVERPPRPDGTRRVFNVGWVFYHMLEHEAGHRAQINLVRHLRSLPTGA
jgi:uncharacterized damage-inducible protein DinB